MCKAGVLAIPAAWLARVPVRVYNNHGMALVSARGFKRWLLTTVEKVTCYFATDVLYASNSCMQAAIDAGIVRPPKARVIGPGTASGISVSKFDPEINAAKGRALREECGIPPDAFLVGFVGRLVEHKGVRMMIAAWRLLPEDLRSRSYLCFFGSGDDPAVAALIDQAAQEPDLRVRRMGQQADMPAWYSTMTLLASPSWHEGFPHNVLESACCKVPTVGTRATGTLDAVVDGETGILTPIEDAPSFAAALTRLLTDERLRHKMGEAARERILREFSRDRIISLFIDEYGRLAAR
jgi:glycosyltransferase involved in cell wall biosynthesis